jgi:adenine-specific DNA-methyltransferase
MNKKKQLGQYFTPNFVADFMLSLSSASKNSAVLEPSSGEGVFLDVLTAAGYDNVDAYEVDPEVVVGHKDKVKIQSFITLDTSKKYSLVIGNPPYVRWKNMSDEQKNELGSNRYWQKYFNSLSDYLYIFILKSVELLEDGGELIFITPEYWLSTMHSQTLRNYLVKHGNIDEIYHFSETPIFDKVASSIIIFKFTKASNSKQTSIHRYIGKGRLTSDDLHHSNRTNRWDTFTVNKFEHNTAWILAPDDIKNELTDYEEKCKIGFNKNHHETLPELDVPYTKLGDITTIANGLVSGLDKAFQLSDDDARSLNDSEKAATLQVIKAKDMSSIVSNGGRQYIFLNETEIDERELETTYPMFHKQLSGYKEQLLKRYSYAKQINYWDWVFLRSMKLFHTNQEKIFVPCKERITNKSRLRFCYAPSNAYPTQDMTAIYLDPSVRESIHYILALLNSELTYEWVKYKGLIKGGIAEFSEKPLTTVPIRLIDWSNRSEVEIHDQIVDAVKRYNGEDHILDEIDSLIKKLI